MQTDIANESPETQTPPLSHTWHFGRFYAADQGGTPPDGHRWLSVERYQGALLIYIGARWWIEWAAT